MWKTWSPNRPEIQFRQLCALIRDLLTQQPTLSGTDLTDAVKTQVVHLGFADPPTSAVYPALDAVERALRRVQPPASSSATPPPDSVSLERPLSKQEAAVLLAGVRKRLGLYVIEPRRPAPQCKHQDTERARQRMKFVKHNTQTE